MAAVGEVIAVIDDEEFMLEAMDRLLCALGFKTELYGSAEAFVAAAIDSQAACLLSDIHLGDSTLRLGAQPGGRSIDAAPKAYFGDVNRRPR